MRREMINVYDIAYAAAVILSAPVWAAKRNSREKILVALAQRMGHMLPREDSAPAIAIHAVSLGEMNATRELVNQLQNARPDLHVVITTTTATGYDRGRQLYGGKSGITLVRYPLDFTSAINRFLNALRPELIVLMEGEMWPNFLRQCERRNIPVVLVNGRISDSAYKRYRRIKFITGPMLRGISAVCTQDQEYADRFKSLGAPVEKIAITGTMKFDTAEVADRIAGDDQLAGELGLATDAGPIWVCGSTGPGEEAVVLNAFGNLLKSFPTLRLIIIPRKPERFDEVARLIETSGFQVLRRSTYQTALPGALPVILGDTIGELRKFYSLASVVFVGRSLIDLGSRQRGSDMLEPAALAKPVLLGPWTQNFADAIRRLRAADAIAEVPSESALTKKIADWLIDPAAAIAIGKRAQIVVRDNQGNTAKHVQLILQHLPPLPG